MLTFSLFFLLFLFLYLGVPIAISLGLSVLVAYALFVPLPLLSLAQKFYTSLDSFPLMAIPFFVLASNLMATGGGNFLTKTSTPMWMPMRSAREEPMSPAQISMLMMSSSPQESVVPKP